MPALTREALIDLVMRETTDEVTADGLPIARPNILEVGCRYVRNDPRLGYEKPAEAARAFAGLIADAVLKALPAEPSSDGKVEPYHARQIAEEIAEGSGFWKACSGCQESVDGYVSERDYPYNRVFQCQPGGGCSECGGLGVLWDNIDYDAMARDILADEDEPLNSQDDDAERCGACLIAFKPDDLCATDIELGVAHAACLEGSPAVDLATGAPLPEETPILTYRYDSLPTAIGEDRA